MFTYNEDNQHNGGGWWSFCKKNVLNNTSHKGPWLKEQHLIAPYTPPTISSSRELCRLLYKRFVNEICFNVKMVMRVIFPFWPLVGSVVYGRVWTTNLYYRFSWKTFWEKAMTEKVTTHKSNLGHSIKNNKQLRGGTGPEMWGKNMSVLHHGPLSELLLFLTFYPSILKCDSDHSQQRSQDVLPKESGTGAV